MCEICTKLTIKTSKRLSAVFIANFGHISNDKWTWLRESQVTRYVNYYKKNPFFPYI